MAKKNKGKTNQNRRSTKSVKSSNNPRRVAKTAATPVENVEKKESVSSNSGGAAATVLPFGRMNYILLLACVGLIILGFFLMSLEDFVDATQFSVSLHVAPPIVVAGFIGIIYAILYKPKETKESQA